MPNIQPVTAESIALATQLIKQGDVVVIPTDTVYGIVCDPFNADAVKALFAAKQRPAAKSVQILSSGFYDLEALGLTIPEAIKPAANVYMPGAFSPICSADNDCKLATVRAEDKSQGVRIPDNAVVRSILSATGPLAASSANRSGKVSPQTVQECVHDLGESVALYLDSGPTPGATASTVVKANPLDPDGITVLREGVISEQDVRKTIRSAQTSFRTHA